MFISIPNGNAYTQGIGILEVLCKVMETIIDTRTKKAVTFHDILRGFFAGRGMGTVILEIKFAQDLASVDQEPLLLVLLDLRKVYDNLERGRLLKTLEIYGAGSKNVGHSGRVLGAAGGGHLA